MMKNALNKLINGPKAAFLSADNLIGTLKTKIQNRKSKYINYYFDFFRQFK